MDDVASPPLSPFSGNPKALEFLRMDCTNVLAFFAKRGIVVPTVRRLFDFVVNPDFNESKNDAMFDEVQIPCTRVSSPM
jgi:serine/threonine-protein kinase RIO1